MSENVLRSLRGPSETTTIPTTQDESVKCDSANWRLWTLCAGSALAVLILIVVIGSIQHRANSPVGVSEETARSSPSPSTIADSPTRLSAGSIHGALQAPSAAPQAMMDAAGTRSASQTAASVRESVQQQAPMIARTVWLTIVVKDIRTSRAALDALLSQYQGYPAQLTINTPEDAIRSVQASLRIPSPELSMALADLRKLGRVQSESQSGEEVTQQHADLVARLRNARDTEQRLLAILQQRTGKVAEVLEVEEQISSTRGDLERMEAEQKALEHRVDFASVNLQLSEDYKAQLNPPSTAVGTRMHNAFVAGIANARGSLLAMVLLFEEYGPVLVIWLALLGTPLVVLWRRYRATAVIQGP